MPAVMRAFKALDHNAKKKAIDVFMSDFVLINLAAKEEHYSLRLRAIEAFNCRLIDDPRVVEPLIQLSKDDNPTVRKEAIAVLNRREELLLKNALKPEHAP